MNDLTLLNLKYVIKISIVHVIHWGKHCETRKRLLCFLENDKNFLNITLTRAANFWNVGTWIMTMLLYKNHIKTSSLIHMYHYSLSSVHKLLIDLTKHSKTKQSKTKQNIIISLSVHQMYVSAYGMFVCTHVCMFLITQCSRVLLQKLTSFQLVEKFPAFYGTRGFITVYTSAWHLSLS